MDNQTGNTQENPNQTSTNPAIDALVAKTLSNIRDTSTIPQRLDMRLPVTYEQFCALIKAQAERIMAEQGKAEEYAIDANVEAVMRRIYGFTCSGSRKGIALIGPFGCGKTLIMRSYIASHNALVTTSEHKLRRGLYVDTSASRLFRELSTAGIDHFDKLSRVPLFIDELGREAVIGKSFGTVVMPTVDLLFERWNYGAITHITSNLGLETLSDDDHYGKMAGSRIADMFVFIEMKGHDRRKRA
jgi:DNA replication protein DnaC